MTLLTYFIALLNAIPDAVTLIKNLKVMNYDKYIILSVKCKFSGTPLYQNYLNQFYGFNLSLKNNSSITDYMNLTKLTNNEITELNNTYNQLIINKQYIILSVKCKFSGTPLYQNYLNQFYGFNLSLKNNSSITDYMNLTKLTNNEITELNNTYNQLIINKQPIIVSGNTKYNFYISKLNYNEIFTITSFEGSDSLLIILVIVMLIVTISLNQSINDRINEMR